MSQLKGLKSFKKHKFKRIAREKTEIGSLLVELAIHILIYYENSKGKRTFILYFENKSKSYRQLIEVFE